MVIGFSKINLFIVETPLQLMNAIEAIYYFGLKHNHLLLHTGGTGFPLNYFSEMLAYNDWEKIRYIRFKALTFNHNPNYTFHRLSTIFQSFLYDLQKVVNLQILNHLCRCYTTVDNIFLGNYLRGYQEYMRHIANTITYNSLYLLDDGTDALLINEERSNLNCFSTKTSTGFFKTKLKQALKSCIIDLNIKDAPQLTFYSAYDLDVNKHDKLIKNSFNHLKLLQIPKSKSSGIYFLGECLVEDSSISLDVYISYLGRVKKFFNNKSITYIPHPRESAFTVSSIEQKLNFFIKKLNRSIEIDLCFNPEKPDIVAAFFCSALINCKHIAGSNIKVISFYLPPDILNRYKKLSHRVYNYFQHNSNSTIDLIKNY